MTTTPPTDRMPVLIVSGFLGAGKTTFIRELLPRIADGPRAPYVILNDFQNASIDAHSLRNLGAEIKSLSAGCVCCEDTNSLADAILRIPSLLHPILIIEANGTTDPFRLIEILTLTPRLRDRLGAILQVTVINEKRWGKRWLPGDKRTERAQAATASAIFTNRGEVASEKQKQRLTDNLLEINPRAPRIDTDTLADLILREAAEQTLPSPDISDPIAHIHHHVAIRLEPPTLDMESLRKWLISLPHEILRVKGLVRISDTKMAYINRTDDPLEAPRIVETSIQEGMEPCIVLIAPGLDEAFLKNSFHQKAKPAPFKLR